MSSTPPDPLTKAAAAVGNKAALARALHRSKSVIAQWRKAGVPADHCMRIEALTREAAQRRGDPALIVTCEQLRPDLAWHVLRGNP